MCWTSVSICSHQAECEICSPYGFMATSFWNSFNSSCCCTICFGDPFVYPSRIRGETGRGIKPCLRALNGGACPFTCCSESVWCWTEPAAAVSWRQRTCVVCKHFLRDVARELNKRGVTVRGIRMGIRNGACCVVVCVYRRIIYAKATSNFLLWTLQTLLRRLRQLIALSIASSQLYPH